MTNTSQLKRKGPSKLVSKQAVHQCPTSPHQSNPEVSNQDESNLSKPSLEDDDELWARQKYINERRTANGLTQLQEAKQELHNSHQEQHQTLQE